jgi:peptide methionine sulfoxide reductase MsrB
MVSSRLYFISLVLIALSLSPSAESFMQSLARRIISHKRTATFSTSLAALFGKSMMKPSGTYPIRGEESLMSPKAHGTCTQPVQKSLRWGCDWDTADRICCFNRHYAEHSGYWANKKEFFVEMEKNEEIAFYDSVTGKPLFVAPRGRTMEEFKKESLSHGWPSFRDEEVVWDNMRCLDNGESVSVDGTHLGHNLPDRNGNRYCINLVSVAGKP